MMGEYLALFISAVVINNFVLTKFLGLCIFFGISKNLSASAGMGVAVTAVMTMSSILAWIVYNFILARAEVFASKHGVVESFCDGFGMGCGFTLAMLAISAIREILGSGTFLGMPVFGAGYQPMLMMVLPPGAFMLIGYLVAATKTWNHHKEQQRAKAARVAAAKAAATATAKGGDE